MIDEVTGQNIRKTAVKWAASVPLATEADFDTAVAEQLGTITRGPALKRRNTILRLAEAAVDPEISRRSVFRASDVISERVFYDTQKDWFHDPEYRQTLERVIALYERWWAEEEIRTQRQRQAAWREQAYQTGRRMIETVLNMLDFPLQEIETDKEVTTLPDGRTQIVNTTIVKPGAWRVADSATMATAADKIVRLALDMATDKTEQDTRVGLTEEYAQAITDARASVMQKFDALMEKQLEDTADDGDDES